MTYESEMLKLQKKQVQLLKEIASSLRYLNHQLAMPEDDSAMDLIPEKVVTPDGRTQWPLGVEPMSENDL